MGKNMTTGMLATVHAHTDGDSTAAPPPPMLHAYVCQGEEGVWGHTTESHYGGQLELLRSVGGGGSNHVLDLGCVPMCWTGETVKSERSHGQSGEAEKRSLPWVLRAKQNKAERGWMRLHERRV